MTTISATKPAQPIGLYLLNLDVGRPEVPGAPLLHVQALVDAPTGKVSGHAEITQALAPPNADIKINNLTGQVHELDVLPSAPIVTLSGTFVVEFPPPAIGMISEPFNAVLVLPRGDEPGSGSFTYGTKTVTNVPVIDAQEGA